MNIVPEIPALSRGRSMMLNHTGCPHKHAVTPKRKNNLPFASP